MSSLERNIPIWKICSGACLRDWWGASRTGMATVASDGWGSVLSWGPGKQLEVFFFCFIPHSWYVWFHVVRVCVCVCACVCVFILECKVHGGSGGAWWRADRPEVSFQDVVAKPRGITPEDSDSPPDQALLLYRSQWATCCPLGEAKSNWPTYGGEGLVGGALLHPLFWCGAPGVGHGTL